MKNCKYCDETDPKKFSEHQHTRCRKCRREYDRKYYLRRKAAGYRQEYTPKLRDNIYSFEFPERELLCAIIEQAVKDWKRAKKAERILEIHSFFISMWYFDLCTLLELEPNAILKEIGIGFRFEVADKPPINEDQVYA